MKTIIINLLPQATQTVSWDKSKLTTLNRECKHQTIFISQDQLTRLIRYINTHHASNSEYIDKGHYIKVVFHWR